ncbi:MAG: DNA-3-methyladenine glycosylase I [Alphaproteobacteria bacterium]|nr:DNA-3-methyladenine glycosylase I [Alphaproteobacteria bacterium]
MRAVPPDGLLTGEDGRVRCWWPGNDPEYLRYHDEEWGRPVRDDVRLFEKICLEGFQAGLSWITILRRRDHFRAAFAGFDFEKMASYTQADVERLLQNPGIIRHRGKIEAAISNAQKTCDLIAGEGSLADFIWRYAPAETARPARMNYETLRTMPQTPASQALSKDLKKRGFRFVGPTTMYALMQAAGLVNDHLEGCWCRDNILKS